MKSILLVLLLLVLTHAFAQEKPVKQRSKVTPEEIKRLLDFESLDRELNQERDMRLREHLRRLHPQKGDVEEYIELAVRRGAS